MNAQRKFRSALMVIAMNAAGAQLYGNDKVIVQLPHKVTLKETVLEPGKYRIEEPRGGTNSGILRIYSDKGTVFEGSARTIGTLDKSTPNETQVVLQRIGSDYYFDKIWIQGKNYGYEFLLPAAVEARKQERRESLNVPATWEKDTKSADTSIFANTRIKTLTKQLEVNLDSFEGRFTAALDKSKLNRTDLEDRLQEWASGLENEVDNLAEAFDDKDSVKLNNHLENSMMFATALNRAMLARDLSSLAEGGWNKIREDLNGIAILMNRPVLPNLTVVTVVFVPATPALLNKTDVKQVMSELETSTGRFKEKFENAWYSSITGRRQREIFENWVEALEDSTDDMRDEFKEGDAKEFQRKLEATLLLASGVNRMIIRSTTSPEPVREWERVRSHLNTLTQVFDYPALPNSVVQVAQR